MINRKLVYILFFILIIFDSCSIIGIRKNYKRKDRYFYVLQRGHLHNIKAFDISSDKKFLLTADSESIIKLWNLDNNRLIMNYSDYLGHISDIKFSPDNTFFCVAGKRNKIYLLDLYGDYRGILKYPSKYKKNRIYTIMLFKENKIISGDNKGNIAIWDLNKNKLEKIKKVHNNKIYYITILGDNKGIITISKDGYVKIIDNNLNILKEFKVKEEEYRNKNLVTSDKNGENIVISETITKEIIIYNLKKDKIKIIKNAHKNKITCLENIGKYFITSGRDKRIKLWNFKGRLIKSFLFPDKNVLKIFKDKDKLKAISVIDKSIKIYDISDNKIVSYFKGVKDIITKMAIDKDFKYIALITGNNKLKIFNNKGELLRSVKTGKYPIYDIKILNNDKYKYIITAGSDGILKVWSIRGRFLKSFNTKSIIYQIAVNPSGNYIALGLYNRKVYILDINKGLIFISKKFKRFIRALDFSFDGKLLAASDWDGNIKIWKISKKSLNLYKRFKSHLNGVSILKFDRLNKKLYIGNSFDGDLEIFDIEKLTYRVLRNLHYGRITDISFSFDGKYFATSGIDSYINIYERKSNKLIREIPAHLGEVVNISFIPESEYLISAGRDNYINIYHSPLKTFNSLLYTFFKNEWYVFSSSGYFDTTINGSKFLSITYRLNSYDIDRFGLILNRPDLIYQYFNFVQDRDIYLFYRYYKKRLRKAGYTVDTVSDLIDNAPEAKILKVKKEEYGVKIIFKLHDTWFPLKRYNIFVNNVPLFKGIGKKAAKDEYTYTSIISNSVPLLYGINKVEITCYNDRWIESLRPFKIIKWNKKIKGDLYFIGIGISKFKDKKLNLNFADKDVKDLAKMFKKMKKGFNNIYIKTLLNKDAVKKNVVKLSQFVKNATYKDTVILYISGHGMHDIDNDMTYYYILYDTSPENLSRTAISFREIEKIMYNTQARNKLLLLDTCESGTLDDRSLNLSLALSKTNKFRPTTKKEFIKWLSKRRKIFKLDKNRYIFSDIFRRSGTIVFASSKGGELSFEFPEIKNGIFTYMIKRAFTDKNADLNHNGYISVNELKKYVKKWVPLVTDDYQHPTVDIDNLYQDFEFPLL